jgi:hypothetical protein
MGSYRLPGHAHFNQGDASGASGVLAVQKPTEPQGLKHTAPREKFLCLKQEVLTAWESVTDADVAAKFKELVAKHNSELNPSGVPFKSRRSLEPDGETAVQAEPLKPREGQYPDVAALKAGDWVGAWLAREWHCILVAFLPDLADPGRKPAKSTRLP